MEAIPLGNGHIGAMVFGGAEKERIVLNDISLWSGEKYDLTNPAAREAVHEVRQLFFEGKYTEAEQLAELSLVSMEPADGSKSIDAVFGCYQTLGNLEIFFDDSSGTVPGTAGKQFLDMESGVCRIEYELRGKGKFVRECFVSAPDDVFSFRMTADREKSITALIRLRREKDSVMNVLPDGSLLMSGTLSGGLRFAVRAKVIVRGGSLEMTQDSIRVGNADELRILLASATTYTTQTPERQIETTLLRAADRGHGELRGRHMEDFSSLYRRASLTLGKETGEPRNIREFFEDLVANRNHGACASLFFRFNRYLLISCSRPRNLPANIQGLWCADYKPPWNSDYHLNANTQMVYWPAESVNLAECHLPLLEWLADLAKAGAETAGKHFGAHGWCAAWVANPWGYTTPGKNLQWGLFPEAGAWMCLDVRDHFEYGGDTEFLRRFFSCLRGSCEFCLDMLTEDPASGKLVFGPTVAPEHGYLAKDGKRVFVACGTAAGQEIVYELFRFTKKAADILKEDAVFRSKLDSVMGRLALPGPDAEGMISKWITPLESDGERHLRHTFGHYPGERISYEKTPELIAPLEKTLLDHETHTFPWGAGSWSGAWLIHHWARLRKSEKAFQMLDMLMKQTLAPNMFALNGKVFQADGNLGSLSGIVEMLLQSHDETVRILPALPREWPEGRVQGFRARGGFELGFEWSNGKLNKLQVISRKGGKCRLHYGSVKNVLDTVENGIYTLDGSLCPAE